MALNLDKFIKIIIKSGENSSRFASRDTAVLICDNTLNIINPASADYTLLESYEDLDKNVSNPSEKLKKYVHIFFDNKGVKLKLVKRINSDSIKTTIKSLDRDLITVAYCSDDSSKLTKADFPDNITNTSDQKILVSWDKLDDGYSHLNSNTSQFFIVKYGDPGVEMTVLAYLTNINGYYYESVQDYDFTVEELKEEYYTQPSDTIVENAIVKNYNVDAELAGELRNIGGNDTGGYSLVNDFMMILLSQTLSDKLLNVITSKIKYNQNGLNIIQSTIIQELDRYVNCGYLTKDKVWTDDTLIVPEGYTLITKNTPLTQGYKFIILPFSTLNDAEKNNHELPKIYLLLAESYSIRSIEINGKTL